ncbi:uncharacterized protein LOC120261204 [Dioscorea cayenensis subsp. rotundata]|uniref:Uncharacterized protein LOC120261204 n=1 Tax=Dioscorea cayennensis subsp. rotundata TaxID=55577 RepID=A0AB40BC92_DIOCR|nr:uncharacterized protein LOC120261204 [Dioscorea cayenensis subsp. rotundata]
MALPFLVTKPLHFLLLIFLIAHANLSTCTTVTTTATAAAALLLKGSVSCLDCTSLQDFSGVKVAVSCSHTSQVVSTLTNKKGEFEVKLPSSSSSSSSSSAKCIATLLGGKVQLCAYRKDMVSKLVKPQGSTSNSFVLTTPLNFFTTSCPSRTVHAPTMYEKLDDHDRSSSSSPSTPENIPQPYPWGLPPPCYFCHFLPIIGIP